MLEGSLLIVPSRWLCGLIELFSVMIGPVSETSAVKAVAVAQKKISVSQLKCQWCCQDLVSLVETIRSGG